MPAPTSVTRRRFGVLPDGTPIDLWTLRNAGGSTVDVCTLGATVVAWQVPSESGTQLDIVLGFGTLEGYLSRPVYFGSTVGRFANRIANARFQLDGRSYELSANEPPHHLHGGRRGFDCRVWTGRADATAGDERVVFSYESADGEEGYPGTLRATVSFTLTDLDELVMTYWVSTTAATPVNLTNHCYFNLDGEGAGDILDHSLQVCAQAYTPVTEGLIPDGRVLTVMDSPFDFRAAHAIGARLHQSDAQLQRAGGYDHNLVLDRFDGRLRHVAVLANGAGRRSLHVSTTEPGLQLYTGNRLDGSLVGKSGRPYGRFGGICLETQHFPDSPNQPHFPSTILRPGRVYASTTVMRITRT